MNPQAEPDIQTPVKTQAATPVRAAAALAAAALAAALFYYRAQAPHAVDMHPTDEHLLPWYIAAGAGGREAAPKRLHESATHGVLGMDTYAFGVMAGPLEAALR